MTDSEQVNIKKPMNLDHLPILNRHYRFADQILHRQKRRVEVVCTVKYCGDFPPRYTPRPSSRCLVKHCVNARREE